MRSESRPNTMKNGVAIASEAAISRFAGWASTLSTFLPAIAFALVALTGDMYYGLRYPIIVALMTVVIGFLFLPETRDRAIQ
jgi:hypothetical protein